MRGIRWQSLTWKLCSAIVAAIFATLFTRKALVGVQWDRFEVGIRKGRSYADRCRDVNLEDEDTFLSSRRVHFRDLHGGDVALMPSFVLDEIAYWKFGTRCTACQPGECGAFECLEHGLPRTLVFVCGEPDVVRV